MHVETIIVTGASQRTEKNMLQKNETPLGSFDENCLKVGIPWLILMI